MGVGAALIASAAIPAVAGTASSIGSNVANKHAVSSTNAANKEIAQMNNQFNERMMEKQQAYNVENFERQTAFTEKMFDKAADYNSLPSRMAQAKQAGVNPYSALSSGSFGSVSASSSPSVGSVSAPTASQVSMQAPHYDFSGIGSSITAGLDAYSRLKSVASQTDLTDAQARNLQIENQYKSMEITKRLANMEADTKNKEAAAKIGRINAAWQDQMNMQAFTRNAQEIQNMQETFKSLQLANAMQSKVLNNYDEQFRIQIAEAVSRIELQHAQRQLTSQQAVTELKKQILTIAQTSNVNINSRTALRMADALVEQAHANTINLISPRDNETNTFGDALMTGLGFALPGWAGKLFTSKPATIGFRR